MLQLISPAKINLFLQILRRRVDGYHDLASLFQTISLYDHLTFSFAEQDELTCSDACLPTDSSNLIIKAVDLFRRKTGLKFGLKVHLEKHIPYEAGLGGGSSNAATTLWALNELHSRAYPLQDLMTWSAEIGSDITFFLSNGTAYCTGRGEIINSLNPLPKESLWIAKPAQGLSTPTVFKHLDLTQLSLHDPERTLIGFYNGRPLYYNDLEEPAFRIDPALHHIKQQLMEMGFHAVLMTGSGTAFYCLGSKTPYQIPGVTFYPATFIRRQPGQWYSQISI